MQPSDPTAWLAALAVVVGFSLVPLGMLLHGRRHRASTAHRAPDPTADPATARPGTRGYGPSPVDRPEDEPTDRPTGQGQLVPAAVADPAFGALVASRAARIRAHWHRSLTPTIARYARTVAGVGLLGIGSALLVLPGPGLLVITAGLALLATDHAWAQRLLHRIRARVEAARGRIRRGTAGPGQANASPPLKGTPR